MRSYLSSVIGEHKPGSARINTPIENAGNIGVVRESKGRVVPDADEFEFTRSTGLHLCADIDASFATCCVTSRPTAETGIRVSSDEIAG